MLFLLMNALAYAQKEYDGRSEECTIDKIDSGENTNPIETVEVDNIV